MINKLATIANDLDRAGLRALADQVDNVIDELTKKASTLSAANPKDKRSPEWVAAAKEAIKHFDAGMNCFPPEVDMQSGIVLEIEDIRRLIKVNDIQK